MAVACPEYEKPESPPQIGALKVVRGVKKQRLDLEEAGDEFEHLLPKGAEVQQPEIAPVVKPVRHETDVGEKGALGNMRKWIGQKSFWMLFSTASRNVSFLEPLTPCSRTWRWFANPMCMYLEWNTSENLVSNSSFFFSTLKSKRVISALPT
jgi:hypothetical protein